MDNLKVNLRDFRINLTKLRETGLVYTVMKRGEPYGYFVPSTYDIEVKKKISQDAFKKILDDIRKNSVKLPKDVNGKNYKKVYRDLLEKKYLRDE